MQISGVLLCGKASEFLSHSRMSMQGQMLDAVQYQHACRNSQATSAFFVCLFVYLGNFFSLPPPPIHLTHFLFRVQKLGLANLTLGPTFGLATSSFTMTAFSSRRLPPTLWANNLLGLPGLVIGLGQGNQVAGGRFQLHEVKEVVLHSVPGRVIEVTGSHLSK